MKNIIIIASLLLGMPLMAQTKVVKKNAVKAKAYLPAAIIAHREKSTKRWEI